jgi:hypothetical protein
MLAAARESGKEPAVGQHQSQVHFRHLLMMGRRNVINHKRAGHTQSKINNSTIKSMD